MNENEHSLHVDCLCKYKQRLEIIYKDYSHKSIQKKVLPNKFSQTVTYLSCVQSNKKMRKYSNVY